MSEIKDKIKKGVVMAAIAASGLATGLGIDSMDTEIIEPESIAYTQETCPLYWNDKLGFCFETKKKVTNAINITKDKIKANSDEAQFFVELCKKEKTDENCLAKRKEIKDKIIAKEKISLNELHTFSKLSEPVVIENFSGSTEDLLNFLN